MRLSTRSHSLAFSCLLALPMTLGALGASNAATEDAATIILHAGWNLVGLPATPERPEPDRLLQAPIADDLISIWGYAPTEGWSRYEPREGGADRPPPPPGSQPDGRIRPLTSIEGGRAYWIQMRNSVPGDGLTLPYWPRMTGIGREWKAGWNLICFDAEKPIPVPAVFAGDAAVAAKVLEDSVASIHRFNPRTGGFERFGEEPSFRSFERGRGYWIRLKKDLTIRPELVVVLQADVDAQPLGGKDRKAGSGDLDLNRNGTLDDPFHQDTLAIGPVARGGEVIVRNGGQGTLSLDVAPTAWWRSSGSVDEAYPPIPPIEGAGARSGGGWVPANAAETRWLRVDPASGVAPHVGPIAEMVERDRLISLVVDRDGLAPGHYLARLRVASTGGSRDLYAVMTVPPLSGNYEGDVLVSRINERPNEIGHIGLRLCLREAASGPVHGVLDGEESLVFPIDVPLVGGFLDPGRRRFVLSGSYTAPARSPRSPLDSSINPFTVRVRRSVTFLGSETSSGQISGDYWEVIHGPLPFPVVLSGSFALTRRTTGLDSSAAPALPFPSKVIGDAKGPAKSIGKLGVCRGQVFGRYADRSEKPLPDAEIVLAGNHLQMVRRAGADGRFEFPNLIPGVYWIGVSRSGFEQATAGARRGSRLLEVGTDGSLRFADDLGGQPVELALDRKYAAPRAKPRVIVEVDAQTTPATLKASCIVPADFRGEGHWIITRESGEGALGREFVDYRDDQPSFERPCERPGIHSIQLNLERTTEPGAPQGEYVGLKSDPVRVAVGPLAIAAPGLVPIDQIELRVRPDLVGPMAAAEPRDDARPKGAGNQRFVLIGVSVGGPLGGGFADTSSRAGPTPAAPGSEVAPPTSLTARSRPFMLEAGPAAIVSGKEQP